MPKNGDAWWHLILTARNTWIPGDERGFRNRHHRIHSTGDYKNPPPPEEHAGLRNYCKSIAGEEILFPKPLRKPMGNAMLATLQKANLRCIAIAVAKTHCHILVECEDDRDVAKRLTSRLKQTASFAVRNQQPGRLWANGCKAIRARDQNHQRHIFRYILNHSQKEGAWVWQY
ncbi:MAG: hypothetical protein HN909_03110 [Phycisphaerales bacterium]|jgi:REP element-mobilizing transposase RayT|nr:hypothetical protein [Phycisphaerales bacterium]MBT7170740.1 hypothetical protein [Phycisphaerales bacterium]